MNRLIKDIFHSEVVPQSLPFEIITFKGLYHRHKSRYNDLFKCHRIQFNALFIIKSGNGTHSIDCKEYLLQPGTVLPLVKGQVHFFEETLNVDGIIITFTDRFIIEHTSERDLFHFLQLYHSSMLQIDPENLILLEPYLELLIKEQETGSNYLKEDLLKAIFFSLLLQLKRLTPLEHGITDSRRFRNFVKFEQLIAKEYTNTHNAKDYADHLGVSYKYLNDISKEASGKTAKQLIDSWLILEIKRNISENKYSIKEIAFKTGFKEATNFIRFFKNQTGETPKDFSKKL